MDTLEQIRFAFNAKDVGLVDSRTAVKLSSAWDMQEKSKASQESFGFKTLTLGPESLREFPLPDSDTFRTLSRSLSKGMEQEDPAGFSRLEARKSLLDDSSEHLSSLNKILRRSLDTESSIELDKTSDHLLKPSAADKIFVSALSEIRKASAAPSKYPGIARQHYYHALRTLSRLGRGSSKLNVSEELLFRSASLYTRIEIGLSQVDLPASSHLDNAAGYNNIAFSLAERLESKSKGSRLRGEWEWRARANVDKGHLQQREAIIYEESGIVTKSRVKSIRQEAFQCYNMALENLRERCEIKGDFEMLAQAALACGRLLYKFGDDLVEKDRRLSMTRNWTMGRYLREARMAVTNGLIVSKEKEEVEALHDLMGEIDAAMNSSSDIETLYRTPRFPEI